VTLTPSCRQNPATVRFADYCREISRRHHSRRDSLFAGCLSVSTANSRRTWRQPPPRKIPMRLPRLWRRSRSARTRPGGTIPAFCPAQEGGAVKSAMSPLWPRVRAVAGRIGGAFSIQQFTRGSDLQGQPERLIGTAEDAADTVIGTHGDETIRSCKRGVENTLGRSSYE
jgi:hypothetical protein